MGDHIFINIKQRDQEESVLLLGNRTSLHPSVEKRIRKEYNFLPSYMVRFAYHDETCTARTQNRWLTVHEYSLKNGLRFSLRLFGLEFLDRNSMAFSQFHPNGWTQLVGFFILCWRKGYIFLSTCLIVSFAYEPSTTKLVVFIIQRSCGRPRLFIDSSLKVG